MSLVPPTLRQSEETDSGPRLRLVHSPGRRGRVLVPDRLVVGRHKDERCRPPRPADSRCGPRMNGSAIVITSGQEDDPPLAGVGRPLDPPRRLRPPAGAPAREERSSAPEPLASRGLSSRILSVAPPHETKSYWAFSPEVDALADRDRARRFHFRASRRDRPALGPHGERHGGPGQPSRSRGLAEDAVKLADRRRRPRASRLGRRSERPAMKFDLPDEFRRPSSSRAGG